jgi:hypothetical protein
MKLIAFAILALCLRLADAAPLPARNIAAMVAHSEAVMSAGLCVVANDTKDYGSETLTVVLPKPVGVRKILKNDYNWIRSAGYAKGKSGKFLMSERIIEACSVDALSGRCLAARSYWRQK